MRHLVGRNGSIFRRHRPAPKRQMRKRRTAQALVLFGIVLAAVEFYVILGGL